MANFLERFEFEETAKLMAGNDGRKWDELPDNVKEMYVDVAVKHVKDLKKDPHAKRPKVK